MAVPKYDELMKPLLTAVKDGEVYKISDVTAIQKENESVRGKTGRNASHGRQTVFKNRVAWAKISEKAGLLDILFGAARLSYGGRKEGCCRKCRKIDSKPRTASVICRFQWF